MITHVHFQYLSFFLLIPLLKNSTAFLSTLTVIASGRGLLKDYNVIFLLFLFQVNTTKYLFERFPTKSSFAKRILNITMN